MRTYLYNGLEIEEDLNLIHITKKDIRNGSIVFSTIGGDTCYDYGVKFLNHFDKLYHNAPRSDYIEMITYSLVTHGVI